MLFFSSLFVFVCFLLQYINTTGARVCLKELYESKYDPLAISYTVLSGTSYKLIFDKYLYEMDILFFWIFNQIKGKWLWITMRVRTVTINWSFKITIEKSWRWTLKKKERKNVFFSLIKSSIQLFCHLSSNVHLFKQRFLI